MDEQSSSKEKEKEKEKNKKFCLSFTLLNKIIFLYKLNKEFQLNSSLPLKCVVTLLMNPSLVNKINFL